MQAFEASGTVDEQHRLVLDEPLPIAGKTRVKIIVLVSDSPSVAAAPRAEVPAEPTAEPGPDQPIPKGLTPWRAAKLGIKLPPPPPRQSTVRPPEPVRREEPKHGFGGAIPDVFPEKVIKAPGHYGAELVVRRGSQTGKIFGLPVEIDPKQGFGIGAALSNQIVIPDDGILRYHAKITCEVGRYMLRDMALTSRTAVNGNMLDGPTELRNGDIIGLSSGIELVFRQPARNIG